MYRLATDIIFKTVNPEEAKLFLAINTFSAQRKIDPLLVEEYANDMKTGKMRPVDIAVASLPDKRRYLMNGQHVCLAIIAYGKPLRANVSYWKCENEDDLLNLFSTFDANRARTCAQMIRPLQERFTDTAGNVLPLKFLASVASAFFFCGTKGKRVAFGRRPHAKNVLAKILSENPDSVQAIFRLIGRDNLKQGSPFLRVGALTAIVATQKKDPKKSEAFWSRVVSGEMLKKEEAEYKLRRFLFSPPGSNKGGWSFHAYQYATCIVWWKTWINGEKRNSVKVNAMKELPQP